MRKLVCLFLLAIITACNQVSNVAKPIIKNPVVALSSSNNLIKTDGNAQSIKETPSPKPLASNTSPIVLENPIPTSTPKPESSKVVTSSPNLSGNIPISSPSPSRTAEEESFINSLPPRPPGMPFPSNIPPMGIGSQVLPLPPYSVNYPVSDTAREGEIELTFKDEYKVRYNKEKKIFYSLLGNDLSYINSIIIEYKIDSILFNTEVTEEQAEKDEKEGEKSYGYDVVNTLSNYFIKATNINIKEFVEKIRKDSLVRQCNSRIQVSD